MQRHSTTTTTTTSTSTASVAPIVIPTGSTIPSRTKSRLSILTRSEIQGPEHMLDDQRSMISLAEAVLWTRVNPFSPLNTGKFMNVL
mmetsp:Transcript_42825/g.71262  ORF Transcript_42825/g.71262 Transcript_42825/m.71262 type:complete len:87 (-) Transcript_42825:380-640(-)